MIVYIIRYPEEIHNLIIEGMIGVKKTEGLPRNSYIGKIKRDVKITTFRELKLEL